MRAFGWDFVRWGLVFVAYWACLLPSRTLLYWDVLFVNLLHRWWPRKIVSLHETLFVWMLCVLLGYPLLPSNSTTHLCCFARFWMLCEDRCCLLTLFKYLRRLGCGVSHDDTTRGRRTDGDAWVDCQNTHSGRQSYSSSHCTALFFSIISSKLDGLWVIETNSRRPVWWMIRTSDSAALVAPKRRMRKRNIQHLPFLIPSPHVT